LLLFVLLGFSSHGEALQIFAECRRGLVALVGVLPEATEDHLIKSCGNCGTHLVRRYRIIVLNGVAQFLDLGFGKRQLSRGHFVQHCTCRPKVGALIAYAAELFRRHIWDSAGQRHGDGYGLRRSHVTCWIEQLCKTEVEDF
jgi:hypothetical protein